MKRYDPDAKERTCNKCKLTKLLGEFDKDASKPLGRDYTCKECRKHRWRTILYPKLKHSDWYKAKQRRNRMKFPEKFRARELARKIELKAACESCGSDQRLHRHHTDYSKPLEVITLCAKCHVKVHYPAHPNQKENDK